jgi:hypothetical protein
VRDEKWERGARERREKNRKTERERERERTIIKEGILEREDWVK